MRSFPKKFSPSFLEHFLSMLDQLLFANILEVRSVGYSIPFNPGVPGCQEQGFQGLSTIGGCSSAQRPVLFD
jgi:hypothetical protein